MYNTQKKNPLRQAFTMIELIFVIVILGIVSSVGSSIIAQVYESYIMQKAVHNASVKTELAINQLANRLAYRIDVSMLARKQGTTGYVPTTDVYRIANVPLGSLNNMSLEWIGYDNDSLSASNPPAWSGFVDLNASSFTTLSTPGSQLNALGTILNTTTGGATPALLFLGEDEYRNGTQYDAFCLYSNNGCISPIAGAAGTSITLDNTGNRTAGQMYYTEMYQIVSTAYATILTPATPINGINVWDLNLWYNYQPWNGQVYTDGSNATLIKNVSVFRFKHEQNSIRIKLCVIEQISSTSQISICKEKAVIR